MVIAVQLCTLKTVELCTKTGECYGMKLYLSKAVKTFQNHLLNPIIFYLTSPEFAWINGILQPGSRAAFWRHHSEAGNRLASRGDAGSPALSPLALGLLLSPVPDPRQEASGPRAVSAGALSPEGPRLHTPSRPRGKACGPSTSPRPVLPWQPILFPLQPALPGTRSVQMMLFSFPLEAFNKFLPKSSTGTRLS